MSDIDRPFPIRAQPDDVSCGPTCLHALYQHFGDDVPFDSVLGSVERSWHGGTLAVNLARHALERGYGATLYTFNLVVFDPVWFQEKRDIAEQLRLQLVIKPQLKERTTAYLDFLRLGGTIDFTTLGFRLIEKYLHQGLPIITGLSATYLYQSAREHAETNEPDPIAGEPAGHFVVIHGVDKKGRIRIADPYQDNPLDDHLFYRVGSERLIGSILLGALTHDANLLILKPPLRDARNLNR